MHCLAVFFDIAAAFDTIKPHHIKEKILLKVVGENIVSWHYNYITERHLTQESNDSKVTHNLC